MKSSTPTINTKGLHYAGTPDEGLSAAADLDSLPSPYLNGIIKPQQFIRWETQRGCPFRCAFCQHRESDLSMKRRNFSLPRILQEAEWITRNPIIQDIAVLDPIFNSGPDYLKILDHFINQKYTGKIALQCRIEMVKPEFLEKIEQLNNTARVVLEFGLQTIMREEQAIIDRPSNMKRIEAVLTEIKNRSIESEISLIFGLPKQTISSFRKSIDFCKHFQVPTIHAFPLMLLRGTPMYDKKAALGLVESYEIASLEIDRVQSDIPHVVSSPSFTYEDWKEMAKIASKLTEYNNQHNTKLTIRHK